jgi:hypothetical protein
MKNVITMKGCVVYGGRFSSFYEVCEFVDLYIYFIQSLISGVQLVKLAI